MRMFETMRSRIFAASLVLLALNIGGFARAARADGILNPGGQAAGIPNFSLNGGLPNWRACRAQVKAGTGTCKIAILGDSVSSALGSFYGLSDVHAGAWPNQLKAILNFPASNINLSTSSVVGDANATPFPAAFAGFDTRVTFNGWTPLTSVLIFGHNGWQNNDTTAFTFSPSDQTSFPSAPSIQSDHIDIYYVPTGGGAANLTVDIGGSVLCTIPVSAGSPGAFLKATCAVTRGANNYNLKCSNAAVASCAIASIDVYDSTVPSVHVLNGAWQGATMGSIAFTPGNPYDPITSLNLYLPALCVVTEIGNDAAAQTSIVSYAASLTAIVNQCKAVGADVLLTTGFSFSGDTSPITIEQYQAAILAVATSAKVPVWDSLTTIGGARGINTAWAAVIPNGWNAAPIGSANDSSHGSSAEYVWFAMNIAQILQQ